MAAQDREQLKIELQQVNQQINQQTQMRSMEVCGDRMYKMSQIIFSWIYTLIFWLMQENLSFCIFSCVTGCQ